VIVTPFTLAGAMAPTTLAGALSLQNAEALGVIAFAQMVRPGAPVLYGAYTSNVDMKSGAPAFGTPEYTRTALASGQLAPATGSPTAPRMPAPPMRSMRRPPMNRRCRSGARSWAAPIW